MANRIGMATEDSIRTLYERGWSKRKIARELGVDRATVDRYASKPAKVTAGIIPVADPGAGGDGSKPAKVTAGIRRCRSVCAAHADTIRAKVEAGLTAQRIYQDLVEEEGYAGSYEAVKRFVRGLRDSDPRRYHRIEVAPGAEAQIDFGAGAWIVDDMGLKQLPRQSGEYLFEIIMRRYENRSTMMTSNRPLEEWGKLVGDVPAATAILDRFLHHADIIQIRGRSYRLKDRPAPKGKDTASEPPELPTASPPSPTSREGAHSRRRGNCG
jgi:transposase